MKILLAIAISTALPQWGRPCVISVEVKTTNGIQQMCIKRARACLLDGERVSRTLCEAQS